MSALLGQICRHNRRFSPSTGQTINQFVVYISLPALILARFTIMAKSIDFTGHWWVPLSSAWLCFFISALIVWVLSIRLNWSRAKTGALILTVGLANTSFVGFPLLEALMGKEAVSIGILSDQPGSFLILSTLGIFVAAKFGGTQSNLKSVAKRLICFPPFLAMVASLVWALCGAIGYSAVADPLEKIAATLVPLALFSVGFQTNLNFQVIMRRRRPLFFGLALRLFVLPLIIYLSFYKAIRLNDLYSHVAVLESAMATQITAAVVCNEFNLDTELANLMVGLSIPLSLLTVPLWHYCISSLG